MVRKSRSAGCALLEWPNSSLWVSLAPRERQKHRDSLAVAEILFAKSRHEIALFK